MFIIFTTFVGSTFYRRLSVCLFVSLFANKIAKKMYGWIFKRTKFSVSR